MAPVNGLDTNDLLKVVLMMLLTDR
jgi:hypothetical protein